MYGYYYDSSYLLYMIISLAISSYAQLKVHSAFSKYSKIECSKNITGKEAATSVLNYNHVSGVTINQTHGYFTDHFDSRTNNISLSENVHSKTTIAAISVAAHEAGHAVQHATRYAPLRLRHFLVPVTQIGSQMAVPLVLIGLMLPVQYSFIVNLGIILYSLAVFFQVVTLPVEFNASRRALETLKATKILRHDEEEQAKKVLSAAALTYVAATFTALLSLIRLLFIASSRRKR